MSTKVKVVRLPNCDLCAREGNTEPAAYDGKTVFGPWAYMCQRHFQSVGIGLGEGRGQELILEEES